MIVRILVLLQTFFIFETFKEAAAANHRCYVCLPKVGYSISEILRIFPNGSKIPPCSRFDINNPEYARECPSPNHRGCYTQTNGTDVTKTCTEHLVDDCKTANKIHYCYCSGELCNNENVPTEAPLPPTTDDDEDSFSEGSGSFEGSDSRQLETSSETDVNFEVIHVRLPTTKYVVLTTPHPVVGSSTASVNYLTRNFLSAVSSLIVLGVNFNRWL